MLFLWPVDNAIKRINHPFNELRSYGRHEGVDIQAARGDIVRAVMPGTITKIYPWTGGTTGPNAYGRYVKIQHADNYTTLYAHMDSFQPNLMVGQEVVMGQTIGRAGSSGNSTAPHLHFQLMHPLYGLDGYVYPKVLDPKPHLIPGYQMKLLSTSRIGAHIERSTPELLAWLDSLAIWPHSFVVFEIGLADWIKARAPSATVYFRWTEWDNRAGELLSRGVQGGIDFANAMQKSTAVDYYLGLNEPTGEQAISIVNANNFYVGFANRCKELGLKPGGLQIAVGNPPPQYVELMRTGTQAILNANGVITYHSYGGNALLHDSANLALRAIGWREVLGPIPLAFTECLWDNCNTSIPNGPWRDLLRDGHLTIAELGNQLELYNTALVTNRVRMGAAYTVGGLPEWARYDFMLNVDARRKLSDHWAMHVNEVLPSPDPIPIPAWPKRAVVTATAGLRVRLAPNENSPVFIGNLPYNSEVEVLASINGYGKLSLKAGGALLIAGASDPDPSGYVSEQYLRYV